MNVKKCPDHHCPLDRLWRTWMIGAGTAARLDSSTLARLSRTRNLTLDGTATSVLLDWELASDDVTVMPVDPELEPHLAPGSPRHRHATFDIGGHTVHVDWLSARRSKPTFAFIGYRVFVDGLLAGRGGRAQVGLGAATNLPAKALIEDMWLLLIRDPPNHPIDLPGVVRIGRPVMREPLIAPFVVSSGVLTKEEYAQLPFDLQCAIERQTRWFVEQYGEDCLRDDAERHRADLEFVYGI